MHDDEREIAGLWRELIVALFIAHDDGVLFSLGDLAERNSKINLVYETPSEET